MARYSLDHSSKYNLAVGRGTHRQLAAIARQFGIELWHPQLGWLAQPVRCIRPGWRGWSVGWASCQPGYQQRARVHVYTHTIPDGPIWLLAVIDGAHHLRSMLKSGHLEPYHALRRPMRMHPSDVMF